MLLYYKICPCDMLAIHLIYCVIFAVGLLKSVLIYMSREIRNSAKLPMQNSVIVLFADIIMSHVTSNFSSFSICIIMKMLLDRTSVIDKVDNHFIFALLMNDSCIFIFVD